MTAITINLLVEEQLSQQAQARDPLKISVAVGGGLLLVVVALGVLFGQIAERRRSEAAKLQSHWDVLQASSDAGETKTVMMTASDYLAINRSRQIYGPQLALIKDVIPASIQLSQFRFAFATETIAVSAPPAPGLSEIKAARAAAPKTVERLNLTLDGSAASARPEIEVDEFIKSLRVHPVFSQYVSDVRLRSIARSTGKGESDTAANGLPTVAFSIDCVFKEKK
ncbi:MAG: hypothetical protein PCFJNLEI_00014 [Verrucomicrobiae bacterium]|nr:hypothetical protein [Verrucomicrobiae bacterium]